MEKKALQIPSESKLKISTGGWTKTESQILFSALAECQLVLRTYGKQSGDLQKTAQAFIKHLSEYDPDKVIEAVNKHIKKSDEFPTPSDIIEVIEDKTNGRGKPNHHLYRSLCNKRNRGDDLTYLERDYIRDYEDYYLVN